MAYIYKITNDINNKVYIGKTTFTVKTRWSQHKQDYKKQTQEKRPLYEAMRKYGIEHFNIETIEECNSEISSEREIYWIKHYNSYIGFENSNGYNATLGGDGKLRADRQLVLALWNTGKNRTEIREETGYDLATIKNILLEYNITEEEMKERKFSALVQKVAQIDLKTGEIIKVFPCIADANRAVKGSDHISAVCKGKRKSCVGFGWKYID